MAILSTLLAVSEPTGFWETIIRAFDKVCNNYVLAVIFLTVVIRVIWAIVDTYSKYNQQKNERYSAEDATRARQNQSALRKDATGYEPKAE